MCSDYRSGLIRTSFRYVNKVVFSKLTTKFRYTKNKTCKDGTTCVVRLCFAYCILLSMFLVYIYIPLPFGNCCCLCAFYLYHSAILENNVYRIMYRAVFESQRLYCVMIMRL